MKRRSGSPREQAGESAVPGRALPEHSKQKCGKERRVHKGKDELQHVHNIVEGIGQVCGTDGKYDAKNSGGAAHPQIVRVRSAGAAVGLTDIVGPNMI